jgi:hypothetical protein
MAILHAVAVWRATTYLKDSELRELTCQDSCVFLFLFRVGADLGICRSYGIAGYMPVYEDSTHLLALAKSR